MIINRSWKMKNLLPTLGLILLIGLSTSCGAPKIQSNAQPISHAIWDTLLRQHVDDLGLVDYHGMRTDSHQLQQYLDLLRQNPPNDKTWSSEERMVYWINAYNAFTVELILDHYPTESIKDIKNGIPFVNSVWDIKFIEIGGEKLDLNNIEHGILRSDFSDPRIHFALVCASLSCPKLLNAAFTPDQLEQQLEQAARAFFNDPFRNKITGETICLSKILSWYWGDFKGQYTNRYELVDQYTEGFLDRSRPIEFLEYNWSLNEQTPEKRKLLQ